MSVQRTLQKYMDNWKRISHLDFCLLLEDNSVFVTTCEKRLPSAAKLDDFRQSTALCLANTTCCLYKITEKSDVPYLLVVWGSDASVSTIGELAVCPDSKHPGRFFQEKMTKTLLCRNCFWETIQK